MAGESPTLPPEFYKGTLDCVHCGLCLSSCPTYRATGRETSSPRGRVYLMRGAAEGKIPVDGLLAEEMDLCLGCRACETACPSGVEYGALLEMARAATVDTPRGQRIAKRLERWLLRAIVPVPWRLRLLVSAIGAAQRLGLDRAFVRIAGATLPAAASEALVDLVAIAPRVPPAAERGSLPAFTPAMGERRGRVAMFVGCVMPELFGAVGEATVRVLAENGFDVVIPSGQGCCGALLAHAGDHVGAAELASRNARSFEAAGVDALIVNSAGCGAAMREAERWLGAPGRAYAQGARDVMDWLDEVGLRAPSCALPLRVCYDDPCHLIHAQRVAAAPRRILEQIPELELVPHAGADACCGAAGTYNLTQRDMSQRVLSPKLDALAAADPDVIATGNPGCLMQIASGARGRGIRAEVVHPVELLDRAYRVRA